MEKTDKEDRSRPEEQPTPRKSWPNLWVAGILLAALATFIYVQKGPTRSRIERYDFFLTQIREGNILSLEIGEREARGVFKAPPLAPAKLDSDGEIKLPKNSNDDRYALEKHFVVTLPPKLRMKESPPSASDLTRGRRSCGS